MSHTIGLSCGHCVKRVKESLEQRPDVESADVTIDHAAVTGSASADALIDTIKQAGYGAELSHPKAKPLAESSSPSEALTAATPELPADQRHELRQLRLPGTKRLAGRTGRRAGTGKPRGAHCAGDGQRLRRRFSAGR